MPFNQDDTDFYDRNYDYETCTEDYPFECPYCQMAPMYRFPQGPPSHGASGRPPSAPPNFVPSEPKSQQQGVAPKAIDQGAIRFCLYKFVYIWPDRGRGFWAWLTFVGPRSIAGFRWERNNWRYFGMDLRNINSFSCH